MIRKVLPILVAASLALSASAKLCQHTRPMRSQNFDQMKNEIKKVVDICHK